MTARRTYTRHGLTAPMVRVKLAGFSAIDRRTAAARSLIERRREYIAALGGEDELSPQRRRLLDMLTRGELLLDHVDQWLLGQKSMINAKSRALLPVLVQRQALAEHCARLLDRIGLDRVPQKVASLEAYVLDRYGDGAQDEGTTSPPSVEDGRDGRDGSGRLSSVWVEKERGDEHAASRRNERESFASVTPRRADPTRSGSDRPNRRYRSKPSKNAALARDGSDPDPEREPSRQPALRTPIPREDPALVMEEPK